MSDLIARLAARATGGPVAAPSAPRPLGGSDEPTHQTAAGEMGVRPDPSAVDRRSPAERGADLTQATGSTTGLGTVVAARPRLPGATGTGDPAAGEDAGTSEVPSLLHTAAPEAGPRAPADVRSETDDRPPVEPPADPDEGTPFVTTGTPSGTPSADQARTARASGQDADRDADRDPDPAPHVAVARPRADPSNPAAIAEAEAEPIVRVHIERLEVHAAPGSTRRSDRTATAPTPAVSLSEYLRGRREAP